MDRWRELQVICVGINGWTPDEWWNRTLYDAVTVWDGYQMKRKHDFDLQAKQASWIINHIRPSVWGKNWKPIDPKTLYDIEGVEARSKSDEVQEDRTRTLAKFPKTITLA